MLHFYAICGLFLLLFRKFSASTILICALLLMFIVPPLISFLFADRPNYFTEQNLHYLYEQYKYGTTLDVFKSNLNFYHNAFVLSGSDLHDIIETLGRFLFGYFLLCIKLFESIEHKKHLFQKILMSTSAIALAYFIVRWLSLLGIMSTETIYWEPLMKIGIVCTSFLYVSILVLLFIAYGKSKLFAFLQTLGKMTLTNYLLISVICIILLYGIGFGQIGTLPMHVMWLCALLCLIFEIILSMYWLSKFRYGPIEWIWRTLTYKKRIPLRK